MMSIRCLWRRKGIANLWRRERIAEWNEGWVIENMKDMVKISPTEVWSDPSAVWYKKSEVEIVYFDDENNDQAR